MLKRYNPYGVGKSIGGNIYIHREYESVLPAESMERAKKVIPPRIGGKTYDVIKYNPKSGRITFIWCRDFDGVHEPEIMCGSTLIPDESKYMGFRIRALLPMDDPWIYHHKWLMVKDDYTGFDVEESKARSKTWLSLKNIDKSRIGKKSYWEKNVIPLLR